jgi:hypothetical protein
VAGYSLRAARRFPQLVVLVGRTGCLDRAQIRCTRVRIPSLARCQEMPAIAGRVIDWQMGTVCFDPVSLRVAGASESFSRGFRVR